MGAQNKLKRLDKGTIMNIGIVGQGFVGTADREGLQNYFTAGPKEVRAWTISTGVTAPKAAGVIHTDFERGFIRAEVTSYYDYIEYNGELGAKDAGKCRSEGKDYVVNDGDIILFRFRVAIIVALYFGFN